MANYLLKESNKLVLVARSAGPMEDLKKQYPGQVEVIAADLADFSVAERVTSLALKCFSRIDGLVINHGVLGEVKRIADSTSEEWRNVFDVNFFSALSFIRAAIPSLRQTNGRIVLVSSGAATSGYSTWGAYGSSKAAMNHLALTMKAEEPSIMSFKGLPQEGKLLKPEQPGNVMSRLVLDAPPELSGQFLAWNGPELSAFQDS